MEKAETERTQVIMAMAVTKRKHKPSEYSVKCINKPEKEDCISTEIEIKVYGYSNKRKYQYT